MLIEVRREFQGCYETVGTLQANSEEGAIFAYDAAYRSKAQATGISSALPLRQEPFGPRETKAFFDGLIPEGPMRRDLAARFRVGESDFVGILQHLNKECIGALMFQGSESVAPSAPAYRPLSYSELEGLALTPEASSANMIAEARLSLAGAQSKVGLYRAAKSESGWLLPQGSAPSTHIVKAADQRFTDLAINEALCLELARRCKVRCADYMLLDLAYPVIAVARFDRIFPDKSTSIEGYPVPWRLHQEDFCQALGFPLYAKYEMADIRYVPFMERLLRQTSPHFYDDALRLARQIIFDYLIGNCDNHIKNYSLLYAPDWQSASLAPAYDLVSTCIYEQFSREMGISLGSTRALDAVTRDDVALFAGELGVPQKAVLAIADELAQDVRENLATATEHICKEGFLVAEQVAQKMRGGINERIKAISAHSF
ncbi:MAG: HipA domain-containing protein [Raoultibacter sp.]